MGSGGDIRISCRRHDWTEALFTGAVGEPGLRMQPDGHVRMSALLDEPPAFDFLECGLMSFAQAVAKGTKLLGLPIFIRAAFRHSYIFVNKQAGIADPRDLEGKCVGTRYEMTANLWARALLAEEYGVDIGRIRWVQQRAGRDGTCFTLPPGTVMEEVGKEVDLQQWLEEGRIDALIHPDVLPLALLSRPNVRRLFPDAAAEERKSYARAKIVPVMNIIGFRRDEDPARVRRVFDAFCRAKQAGLAAMEDNRDSGLLWYWQAWEEQVALVGRDPVPYSLAKMRPTVEAFVRHAVAHGLLSRSLAPEELFANF